MQEAVPRKEKIDRDDQEMMMAFTKKQIEKGKESSKNDTPIFTEFVRPREQHKIVVNLKVERKRDEDMKNKILVASNALKNGSSAENKKDSRESGRRRGERRLSALGEIIKDEENE
ncbi:hypothetical protein B7P43_G19018, partial [Cryptotermes secundus]